MTSQAGQTLSKINELAAQAAEELGLTVLDTRLSHSGRQKSLEICIYRQESAISFADCEAMSRSVERLLESEEAKGFPMINGPFIVEVVSPGIERRLTTAFEFSLFAGKAVRILTKEKTGSLGTEFSARLTGGDEHSITVSEAEPMLQKQSSRSRSSQNARIAETKNNAATDKLTLALTQIYGVYLWPNSKSYPGK